MIFGPLPKIADPERLADQRASLEGEVSVEGLVRLGTTLAPEGAVREARGRLSFERDERGRVVMAGSAKASLSLACQRCGDLFLYPVEADWRIIYAQSETDEKSLAEQGLDVWYHQGMIDVIEVLEDEIMLALPMAPRHPWDCEPQQRQETTPHPFAALVGLFERGAHDK